MAPLRDEVSVRLFDGEEIFHDESQYLCDRLLSKKMVSLPSISSALSSAWGLPGKVLVRQEAGEILVFQFKEEEVKNRVLSGGPWFYNNSILLLADYDGLSSIDAMSLHHVDVWVAVKGLSMGLRNQKALTRIGQELGVVRRVDPAAVHRKDAVQKVRVRMDVRRWFWPCRRFEFSSTISVVVDLFYEHCHGMCSACGFFRHGGGSCNNLVAAALIEIGLMGAASSAGMWNGKGDGLTSMVAGFEVDVEPGLESAGKSLILVGDGGGGTEEGPVFSAAKPNFKLGLTELTGLGNDGPSYGLLNDVPSVILGPQSSVLGVRKSPYEGLEVYEASPLPKKLMSVLEDELDEPIISFKNKVGRPFGSKNKAPSKKKKKAMVVQIPVVAAGVLESPDDKGKRAM